MCCFILCKCIHTKWSCIVLHISWIEQRYGSFTRTHTQNHTKSAFYFSRDVRLTTRLACCEWLCVHQDKATALQCIIIIFNVVTHGNQTNFQSVCIHFDRIICATRKKNTKWKKISLRIFNANDLLQSKYFRKKANFSIFLWLSSPYTYKCRLFIQCTFFMCNANFLNKIST